jgi:hypothetical protein
VDIVFHSLPYFLNTIDHSSSVGPARASISAPPTLTTAALSTVARGDDISRNHKEDASTVTCGVNGPARISAAARTGELSLQFTKCKTKSTQFQDEKNSDCFIVVKISQIKPLLKLHASKQVRSSTWFLLFAPDYHIGFQNCW